MQWNFCELEIGVCVYEVMISLSNVTYSYQVHFGEYEVSWLTSLFDETPSLSRIYYYFHLAIFHLRECVISNSLSCTHRVEPFFFALEDVLAGIRKLIPRVHGYVDIPEDSALPSHLFNFSSAGLGQIIYASYESSFH